MKVSQKNDLIDILNIDSDFTIYNDRLQKTNTHPNRDRHSRCWNLNREARGRMEGGNRDNSEK